MNSHNAKKPTGGASVRRVVEPPDPNDHLLERILERSNMQAAWKRVSPIYANNMENKSPIHTDLLRAVADSHHCQLLG